MVDIIEELEDQITQHKFLDLNGHHNDAFETMQRALDEIIRLRSHPISGDTHTPSAETTQGGVGNAVRCIETGEIYDSQRQACIDLDLTQAALSQHLNRRTGYKTVRGHTFEKVST